MARGKSVDAVLAEADQQIRVWEANTDFKLGSMTKENVQAEIDDLRREKAELETMRTKMTEKINLVNDKADALNKRVGRIRAGYKAVYGPNSSQYEQAGGTRDTERKRPTKKKSVKTS